MEIATRYNPQNIETKWYRHWEKQGIFQSIPDDREAYTIVMPPPNVTGILHMGHMLNITIQDILIRKARLEGKNACWVPGLDHASIATEAKVVKLLRQQGIKKSDLTREEFLGHAWQWKEKYGGRILTQLKTLGASCDWDRTKFTMDPDLSIAVTKVFVDLHKKGKLYRGLRMTNWDPEACTVLSNEEVIFSEENSQLYYLKYKIVGSDEFISVATTRPETILGDTAVAVHPEDERFKKFQGKKVIVPLIGREVPIIADDYVDIEFGTGALKITPAHDQNDNAIGEKHHLETIDIFTEKAAIKEGYGKYSGMDRFELRKQIAKELDTEGLLLKKENYRNKVGRSERTNSPVEPRLTLQWFVKMDQFSKDALHSVKEEIIKFFPPHFVNMYSNWLKEENVRDWCISRQLWWGHRIPAWSIGEEIFVAHDVDEALVLAKKALGNQIKLSDLKQDEDVLDTWFSSWLWPLSVFNGFDKSKSELDYYYPTNVLVTGWDIIFFWVAKMIMAGNEWAEELLGDQHADNVGTQAFQHVYFTGMVRDNQRRKMSKSLGNSPDALALLENYGADGVRFGMLSSASAGNDIVFDAPIDKKTGEVSNQSKLCEQGLNFANKIWNALRLIKGWPVLDESSEQNQVDQIAIQWMEEKFKHHLGEMEKSYDQYRLSEVVNNQYNFIWNEFCSWYLEMIKPEYGGSIHPKTLEASYSLFERIAITLHPIMPFVTEEIWHALRKRKEGDDVAIAQMPQATTHDVQIVKEVTEIQNLVAKVRELRQQYGLKKSEKLNLIVGSPEFIQLLKEKSSLKALLIKMAVLEKIHSDQSEFSNTVEFISGVNKFFLPIEKEVNWEEEKEKIEKDIAYYEGFLISVEKKLSNDRFVNNAPEIVVKKEIQKKEDAIKKLANLKSALNNIG